MVNTLSSKLCMQEHALQQAVDAQPCILPLTEEMLEEVVAIERACYVHPWTFRNFADSLRSDYHAMALRESPKGPLMGYYVAMRGIEEVHLLNITVNPVYQKKGCAHMLLETLRLWGVSQKIPWIWLEVRENNWRAQHVYEQFGFIHVGMRKNYYPAPTPNGQREHAVLMSLRIC